MSETTDILIETERLFIRKFRPDDWKDLSEILTDEEVVYYEPYEPFTVEQCVEEAKNFAGSSNFYAVVLKAKNKVIGKLYFNDEKNFDTYELGYTFNKSYQGMGYAREGAEALMDFAFREMNVRRIIAYADVTNERSWRLLERLGMRREGEHRETAYKFKDENGNPMWYSSYSYAILKEEKV